MLDVTYEHTPILADHEVSSYTFYKHMSRITGSFSIDRCEWLPYFYFPKHITFFKKVDMQEIEPAT